MIVCTVVHKAAISSSITKVTTDNAGIISVRAVGNTGNLLSKRHITANQHTAHLVTSDICIALSDSTAVSGLGRYYILRHTLFGTIAESNDIVSAVQYFFECIKIEPIIVLFKINNICNLCFDSGYHLNNTRRIRLIFIICIVIVDRRCTDDSMSLNACAHRNHFI